MTQLKLPLILIGPILRRVEPRIVSVFVATSVPCTIHLSVYDGVVDASSPPPEHAAADARTMPFGARFHATLVTAAIDGANPLMPGHRYSYGLLITPDGGAAQSLKDLKLLSDSSQPGYRRGDSDARNPRGEDVEVCAIGYADGQLPSFVTCPVTLDDLIIAHASCRKPHGNGNAAMQYLDSLIDDLHGVDAGRPNMLFLTGDQIYADDVAAALLPGLNALGITLISGDDGALGIEQVLSPAAGGPFDVSTSVLPPGFRQKFVATAGFTSEDAAGHLIGFGEWLAMYCIVWNPELWPVLAVADLSIAKIPSSFLERHRLVVPLQKRIKDDELNSPEDAPRVLGFPAAEAPETLISPLYAAPDDPTRPDVNQDALVESFRDFLDAKSKLLEFRREIPKVRRLLANVPSYMICDDHEVSDDWFMTGAIREKTTGNPLGRCMLRNAMAAYIVCQGWGNDPVRWATDATHRALLGAISNMFTEGWHGGPPVAPFSDAVDLALGLTPAAAPQLDFSFTIDGPMHRAHVLDTRTQRQYSTRFGSPGLLSNLAPADPGRSPAEMRSSALDRQLPEEVLPEGHVLIVISPAPVFGPAVMNELGAILAVNEHDLASFARSTSDRALAKDVTGIPNGTPLGTQFFDAEHWSAHPAAFERLLARLSHFPRVVVLGGDVHYGAAYAMDWAGAGRLSRIIHFTSSAASNGWFGIVRNLMTLNGMSVGLQRIGMPMTRLGWTTTLPMVIEDVSNEPPLPRIRIQTGPVVLSDELFHHSHALTRPPDWIWRSNPILDTRTPADRPVAARAVGVGTEIGGVHDYGPLVAAHANGLDTVAIARGLQFLNNVGIIRFSQEPAGLTVSQSLYSLRARPNPNEHADSYVVHKTLLEPSSITVPVSVGHGG